MRCVRGAGAGVAIGVLLTLLPAPAHAKAVRASDATRLAVPAGAGAVPMLLPGRAVAAGHAGPDWLIGAAPTAAAARLLRAADGRPLMVAGGWRVPVRVARRVAERLRARGLLVWAQANHAAHRTASFDGHQAEYARAHVVPPTLAPPAGGVPIGIVDEQIDLANPDVGAQTRLLNPGPVAGPHGTQVASIASGVSNGAGVVGIYPGTPLLSYRDDGTCGDVAKGVKALVAAGARVVNLSLGFFKPCFPLEVAIAVAYGNRAIVVAAAGNEFRQGNPVSYPAVYPHVLSVAAVDSKERPAYFSSASLAVDLAAPGLDVPVSLPAAFDVRDGTQDGVTVADGTSFSAPMVAAAAAWVMATRPSTFPGQISDVLRFSARDLFELGWDPHTGYGAVDIARAIQLPDPPADPLEPNDGIHYVDGRVFPTPDPPVWRAVRPYAFDASLDSIEDPVDVYLIRVPVGARVAIRLRAKGANLNLYAYDRSQKSLEERPIARSVLGSGRTDVVRLFNDTSQRRTAYIAVGQPRTSNAIFSGTYRLDFKRERRR